MGPRGVTDMEDEYTMWYQLEPACPFPDENTVSLGEYFCAENLAAALQQSIMLLNVLSWRH